MPAGSDLWQLAFLGCAALLVLLKVWHGWRLGFIRQLVALIAVALSYAVGFFGGRFMAPLVGKLFPGPAPMLAVLGGLILGLVVYLSITIVSAIVFKKTEHQTVLVVRWTYGLSGALLGGIYGLFLVWMAVLAVRLFGSIAETQIAVQRSPTIRSASSGGALPRKPEPAGPVMRGLAHMKHSLEHGPAGTVVQHLDPVPPAVYSVLAKFGRMVGNSAAVDRFMAYPGVRPLLDHPKLAALLSDPAVARAAQERHYLALLANPKVVAATNDPDLAALLRQFEFEKALDYALGKPENDAPRPTP